VTIPCPSSSATRRQVDVVDVEGGEMEGGEVEGGEVEGGEVEGGEVEGGEVEGGEVEGGEVEVSEGAWERATPPATMSSATITSLVRYHETLTHQHNL
jgi:hypothetical protein